jgi:alcohol dehydrogenase YqhD (iron-dependent ADH family)
MQWAATLAFNDYQCAGRRSAHFILHYLEHALSGRRATLTHGRGLAAIYPAYFRWLLRQGRSVERLAQLGARLFGITGDLRAQAEGFVRHFEQWLSANGLSQSLYELGFTEDDFPAVADYAVRVYGDGRQLDALGVMTPADIVGIFKDTRRGA